VENRLDTWAAWFTAIGTVAVAVVAIWGDWIRARLAGPQIALALRDERGDLNRRNDGVKEIYYHLFIANRRLWSPAEAVRVLVVGLAKRRPDGSYLAEPLVAPLQLTWAFPTFHELFPTIADSDTCDFGAIDEHSGRFRLSTYITPNNFRRNYHLHKPKDLRYERRSAVVGWIYAGIVKSLIELASRSASNPILLRVSSGCGECAFNGNSPPLLFRYLVGVINSFREVSILAEDNRQIKHIEPSVFN